MSALSVYSRIVHDIFEEKTVKLRVIISFCADMVSRPVERAAPAEYCSYRFGGIVINAIDKVLEDGGAERVLDDVSSLKVLQDPAPCCHAALFISLDQRTLEPPTALITDLLGCEASCRGRRRARTN